MANVKKLIAGLIILAAVAYVVTFMVMNDYQTDLHLVFLELKAVKIEFIILVSFVSGALLGMLSIIPVSMKIRQTGKAKIKAAQTEKVSG